MHESTEIPSQPVTVADRLRSGAHERIENELISADQHVSIYKTARSPIWYVQYNTAKDGQVRESLKTRSKKEARSSAESIVLKLKRGEFTHRPNRAETIVSAAQQRMDYLATREKSPKTLEAYRRCYDQLLHWGRSHEVTTLAHLTVSTLWRFEKALRESGISIPAEGGEAPSRKPHPNMPKSVREKMKTVRSLLKWAVTNDMVGADPSRGYELPPGSSQEMRVFSASEQRLILAEPEADLRDIWQMYLHTGLRAEEFCWLTLDDVQRQPWGLRIRKKICQQTGKTWAPKHGLERFVPLTDPATIAIVERALNSSPGPWLFWAPGTIRKQMGHWCSPRLRRLFQARLKACTIGHGSMHTMRHTFCTFLANRPEITPSQLQAIMGHCDLKTTMHYVHVQDSDTARAMEKVNFGDMLGYLEEDNGKSSQQSGNA